MITKNLLLILFLFAWQLPAQILVPNVIENSDFSKGKAGWETKGRIVRLKEGKEVSDGNPALMIELDNNQDQTLSQLFKLPTNTRFITVHFKVRTSEDFVTTTSQPLQIILWGGNAKHDGLIYKQKLGRTLDWLQTTVSIEALGGKVGLAISLKPGKGKVYFDDFAVEAKSN